MAKQWTAVWVKFKTHEAQTAYYLSTPLPRRVSQAPGGERSIDVLVEGGGYCKSEFRAIPGVEEFDSFLYNDMVDPWPFLTNDHPERALYLTADAA